MGGVKRNAEDAGVSSPRRGSDASPRGRPRRGESAIDRDTVKAREEAKKGGAPAKGDIVWAKTKGFKPWPVRGARGCRYVRGVVWCWACFRGALGVRCASRGV